MPRRQFVADLQSAVAGVSVAGITDVQPGNDDGEFTFLCVAGGETLKISALVPELSDYPSSHMCMLFAPDAAPERVAGALSGIADAAAGKTLLQLLELVSRNLESTDRDGDQQMLDSQEPEEFEDEDDDEEEEEEYFPDDDINPKPFTSRIGNAMSAEGYSTPTSAFRHRIRSDLMIAKANGFKVGHLGGLMDGHGCYVTLACRIAKSGISGEAMQAWQIEPSEYLVAIFHYPNGYKSMDSMKVYDAPTARRYFGVRVGISTTYKPTFQEAVRAFTTLSKDEEKRREESQSQTESEDAEVHKGFRNSFISRPLNELLEERFCQLLHYRYNGMPWSGAEEFYNDHISAHDAHSDLGLNDKYLEPEHVNTAYPNLVTADHIQESTPQEHSLPLVGMQFVLRHFVRCTEFCLICFTKMPDDLQAIKPYVCDKPLCLYQYMSLGFGPSIEHEILSQPKVVDLLVSFCYASARLGRLKDFPAGLSLLVPPTDAYGNDYVGAQQVHTGYMFDRTGQTVAAPTMPGGSVQALKTRFNKVTLEMLFDNHAQKCPVRAGDWIVLRMELKPGGIPSKALHCRIMDTSLYPSVRVSEPVLAATSNDQTLAAHNAAMYHPVGPPPPVQSKAIPLPTPDLNEFVPAGFHIYSQNFDELPDFHKREAIYTLLDTLPSVSEMRQYLLRKSQSPLSAWVDRLPPASLGILRWIIASNRACIVQVGDDDGATTIKKGEDRVYGMGGWSQFRFAMGAPDKERRFIQAVRDTTTRLTLKHSTLFAWHGSPLPNWHSIIREGLNFEHTAHGRAYGHGVYHSLDVNTSLGYANPYGGLGCFWPKSELNVSQALALNEIVNAPQEYVSSSPHLVVAQLDWIQTRYLFVKTSVNNGNGSTTEKKPFESVAQDPAMTPRGVTDKLIIPNHAISSTRRSKAKSTTKNKRQKAAGSSAYDPIDLDADDDDGASVATLAEDLMIFEDEDAHAPQLEIDSLPTPNSTKGKGRASGFLSKLVGSKATPSKPLTDYVPGTLDYSSLPMLQQPAWATTSATKRLMKDFNDLIKVQAREPLHELGWHIDEDKVENIYQWIVELHSFDPTLPLAKDMKSKDIKSVVLELRFGKDYPMSPPFVRVIRPRFLAFNQGGGGHVTAGGAMCMELLTNDGWSAVSSIESILLQVRMAISSLDPKPARIESRGGRNDYGVGEAVEAYIRACQVHGWTVPVGFKEMAYGGSEQGNGYPY
ncbi:hypothetical protein BDV95DRAFT_611164 [Massariosphaeria phaeospora]|uniref:UBC core domain-containing protein n=1 Tax=Massariosphaeria phaeospora TaxID=100035 RepID=A0A7C8I012_9PLEO|nr:hypothetical protein BDV95DRAFT_611164 [Massariosphaeria phaeospora]